MNAHLEKLCREAFDGLGTYSKLADGFRRQTSTGQTCAVYFSNNLAGNLVEIGLSPKALAPIINRTEPDISQWIQAQDKISRRERLVKGERGKYPGLALGTEREVKAFLEAWRTFVANENAPSVQGEKPGQLELTRVEKAATDAGFDLTPTQEGRWCQFRSSAFPFVLGVVIAAGTYRVGFSDSRWGKRAAQSVGLPLLEQDGPWPVTVEAVSGFPSLHALLAQAGQLGPALAGCALERFQVAVKVKPTTTEAERWVVQRIGQDLFRDELIRFWQGRCAVSGLDVVPLLRASHIKPWAACDSDAERLDVYNGLLLAPHLDALFDGGWITFEDNGDMRMASKLLAPQCDLLGIQSSWRLALIAEEHRAYLAYHRQHVFLK